MSYSIPGRPSIALGAGQAARTGDRYWDSIPIFRRRPRI